MSVRAKFKVDKIEITHQNSPGKKEDGSPDYQNSKIKEMRTIHLSPVYGNNDPNHENTKFWDASPSGGMTLGTINPEAWQQFEIGREYYIDFTLAEKKAEKAA